jgi:hypothetical protein
MSKDAKPITTANNAPIIRKPFYSGKSGVAADVNKGEESDETFLKTSENSHRLHIRLPAGR